MKRLARSIVSSWRLEPASWRTASQSAPHIGSTTDVRRRNRIVPGRSLERYSDRK
jgi:hypothetical protein